MPSTTAPGQLNVHCTAEQICAALYASNHDPEYFDTAEAVAERDARITAGVPVVRVTACNSGGSGREAYALIQSGIRHADGTFWPSIEDCPIVHFRRRDGRLTDAENARWLLQRRFWGVDVPIEWVNG
ncbi:hypothetical protein IU501_33025 [Nocardia otitidiscaviarum]|uniref:hypothetical protein n=1 Tax=Nocardia otitidiscaviarum TaxID=1823 RepID=UPI0004A73C10|nr:hypothetical protein [Nocardia otitidiscaviarum]MBF6137796.1 hypothetical protein [Nocardia otitidiscaviarum]MBF6485319.1 hypothetical protein [Nocardia otitidiscaviarum]